MGRGVVACARHGARVPSEDHESLFSPALQFPGIDRSSSGLAASAFIRWAILPMCASFLLYGRMRNTVEALVMDLEW